MGENLHPAHPKPRRFSSRGVVITLVSILAFAVVYGLVVREYEVEGGITTNDSTVTDPGFLAVAKPTDFDARTGTLTVTFEFDVTDPELLDDGDRLAEGIRVVIYAADGTHDLKFPEGEPIGNAEIDVGLAGQVYAYPLDTYAGFFALAVETYERQAGGINETTGTVTSALDVDTSISGWDIKATLMQEGEYPTAFLDLRRAFSTKAFALVLVAMAISVVVLAFIAAVLTVTNRRRFEVALLTWNGALLFALPLLRNYLPGSPPIGAALDIYVYLWVFVFAVTSLVLMLIAWSQQRKAELLEEHAKLEGR
jgi:hypothetical protein